MQPTNELRFVGATSPISGALGLLFESDLGHERKQLSWDDAIKLHSALTALLYEELCPGSVCRRSDAATSGPIFRGP